MVSIERRYQWWGPEGIQWTRWYIHRQYETMEEAQKDFPIVSKVMESKKLKAEYRIV